MLILVVSVFIFRFNTELWSSGNIPRTFLYNKENLLEVYIYIAGILVINDARDVGKKSQYIFNYFKTAFPEETYDIRKSFIDSYRNPMKIESIAKWLNRHSPTEAHKLNVIQFCISVASVDGQLVSKEHEFIKKLHLLLRLPISEFESLMSIHQRQQESKRQEEKRSQPTTNFASRIREISCKILGLDNTAKQEEIKSAYRTLAKKHHPDKFSNDTKMQQQLANERFIEIQKAYEYLSNQ